MNKIIFYGSKISSKMKNVMSTMQFLAPEVDFVTEADVNALAEYYSDDRNILGYPSYVLANAIISDESVPFHGIPVFPLKDAARALHAKPAYIRTSQYVVKRYTFLSHLGLFKNSGDIVEATCGDLTYFTKGTILCIKDLKKPVLIQYTHHFDDGTYFGVLTTFDGKNKSSKYKIVFSESEGITLLPLDFVVKPYFYDVAENGNCRKVTYIDLPDFTIGAYK